MAMVVRSNMMAYNANRQLGMNNNQVSKGIEKLSSGFKINRAADDAAGLAVSEKMKAQIKGLEQASANSQDGISLVQTAEGALTEVHDMLNRMTELATKSANGTINDAVDRDAIQNEVNKLNEEIDRISSSTNFNGIKLLNGTLGSGGASNTKATNTTLTDVAATAGKAVSAALSTGGSNQGDYTTITVGLANGKSYSVDLIHDKANAKLTDKDGNVLGAATPAGPTNTELGAAAIKAFKDTDLGKDFNITQATGVITLENKVAGASAPQVTSFAESQTVASTGVTTGKAQAVAITKGVDAFKTASAFTNFDGTNAEDAVFEVGGKKFAFVTTTLATTENLAKLGKDVTFVKATGASAATAEVAEMVLQINQKTGLKAVASDTAGVTTATANNTAISLIGDTAASGTSGGLTLQIGETGEDFNQVTVSVADMSSTGIGTNGLDVNSQAAAKTAIETIKAGINKVSTNRGELGALQNRLEHTINNLDVSAENMTSANSRIRDTDMAKQMMEYTKMNVLTQSAQAMLATANQAPQSILQLLQ